MKNQKKSKKFLKKENSGITLIALVISVIVLLILSGISISMISGENGILKQAGNARTQTDIAGEKEILQTSALAAISKEKYGDLTKEKLDDELNKYSEIQSTEQVDDGIVVTFKSNRVYIVNFSGDVSRYYDIAIDNLVVKDGDNVLAENCKSVTPGKSLSINFNATMPNGTIKSITPNVAYTTTGSTTETFTIIGITSDGEEITKKYTVNLKGYYNIPDLKVGDFVNYTLNTPTAEQLARLNSDISTYSGATDNTTKTAEGNTLLCRVLEVDSNGNPTKLISADGVNSLSLKGANGYNNGVYLINEMCKTLYSGEQGTTRSLTIEDLENNYFSDETMRIRDSYTPTNGIKYGTTIYDSNNAQYPNIALEEAKMGIGTTIEHGKNSIREGGLGLSEQNTTYTGSGDTSNLESTKKGITATQTFYYIKSNSDNYKNAMLYNIFNYIPTLNGSSEKEYISVYWLSSRCFDTYFKYCRFCITYLGAGGMSLAPLFISSGEEYGKSFAVRPLITLQSDVQTEYSTKYNDTYNTWNLK